MNPLDIEQVQTCTLCPMLGKDHVPSVGNPDADLMVIGQSPGKTEVELGEPFMGPSGELLDYLLDEAELVREDIYIANVLKCRPPGNRVGRPEEMANCWRRWLFQEIKQVKPKVILLLGKDAHTQVMPKTVEFSHNLLTEGKTLKFLTSYHPSYFLRRRGSLEEFLKVGVRLKGVLSRA